MLDSLLVTKHGSTLYYVLLFWSNHHPTDTSPYVHRTIHSPLLILELRYWGSRLRRVFHIESTKLRTRNLEENRLLKG